MSRAVDRAGVARGRTDYTLRLKFTEGTQPVAVALIEAKKESLPPPHGLEQANLTRKPPRKPTASSRATNRS